MRLPRHQAMSDSSTVNKKPSRVNSGSKPEAGDRENNPRKGAGVKCPKCDGKGKIAGFGCPGFRYMELPCPICKDAGELPKGIVFDLDRGKKLRETRIKLNMTIRERAKMLGMKSVVELSENEHGYFRKEELTK